MKQVEAVYNIEVFCFSFRKFINYDLHSDAIYLRFCEETEAENQWTSVELTKWKNM